MADIPTGFRPIHYDSGKVHTVKTASSTTITKGDALDVSSGYVQRATSSTDEVRWVSLQDKTTASAAHEDILALYTDGIEFLATCNGTPSQASHFGIYADLTDHNTVNESASSNDVFYITEIVDTTNKIIKGFFIGNIS